MCYSSKAGIPLSVIMTDFETYLRELGWSKKEFSLRTGVHPNTISKWVDGAPGYAMAYVRLAVDVKRVLE